MSNAFFRFKQFSVWQEHCAMKVSTDACIQGAWTQASHSVKRVLDVGAGTGLLSLMLAQRLPEVLIDAVEWNEAAAAQAATNVCDSPFADRIRVVQADATQWKPNYQYDHIICNPPFFKNALHGPDAARNAARHSDTLNTGALVRLTLENLNPDGFASFLWPKNEFEIFAAQAESTGLHLHQQLNICHRVHNRASRIVGIFSQATASSKEEETLVIKDKDDQYTAAFVQLLAPFYLHL